MLIDLTGQRFGRLTVIERAENTRSYYTTRPTWRCRCDCGNEAIVIGENLKRGGTRSCGCLRVEKLKERARRKRDEKARRELP